MMLATTKGLRVIGDVEILLVLLGDQLDAKNRALTSLDKTRDAVLMMEVEEEATHVPNHRQRTILFLSAMRHFAAETAARGFRIDYVELNAPQNTQTSEGEILRAVRRLRPARTRFVHPGEWRVLLMIQNLRKKLGIPIEILPDTHFLVSMEEFEAWAEGRQAFLLEHFYRTQRRRLSLLMTPYGEPLGGEWSYDKENRSSFRSTPSVPEPYRPRTDALTRDVIAMVDDRFSDAPGRSDTFRWPVTRRHAKKALYDFITHRLPYFGTYQDAMWSGEAFLYHSLLSPLLNLKLLNPRECMIAAMDAYRARRVSLNSVEGFLRQVVGWREYIRGMYWHAGPGYERQNALDAQGRLPSFYWDGETDMNCIRETVHQILTYGYAHHIQRLMVTGNFALIAGVDPKAVCDWYLAMYVDAVDWVTAPNTRGMILYADGGMIGSKPYAASGKYIKRMSNYCGTCRYDATKRAGERTCPFNTLYWDFLLQHRHRFKKHQRMLLIFSNLEQLTSSERRRIRAAARNLKRDFGISPLIS